MKTKIGIWLLALIFCGLTVQGARADGHTWNNYHWANMNAGPIPLIVVNSVTPEWGDEFDQALTEWSIGTTDGPNNGAAPSPQMFAFVEMSGSKDSRSRKKCTAVEGQMRVCNANYGGAWLGLASINLDENGHIKKGIAKVNDFYAGYWSNYPTEMRHVMCQEFAHVLGLGHTSEDGSSDNTCMDYSSFEAAANSYTPNQADYDALATMYVDATGDQLGTDDYNSYDDGAGENGGNDPKPCNPNSPKCQSAGGPEEPPMGVRVHQGRNHEIWVARGRGKTLWVHHIRLAPKEYR